MFVDELRRAVEASPRAELPAVSGLLWRAYAAGQVSEAEAQALSEAIELKRAIPAPQKPAQRRVGSRPRSGASMERRRRWAASGCRVAGFRCRNPAPSEPDVTIARHPAQASAAWHPLRAWCP